MDYHCTYKDIFEMIHNHFRLSLDVQLKILKDSIALNLS